MGEGVLELGSGFPASPGTPSDASPPAETGEERRAGPPESVKGLGAEVEGKPKSKRLLPSRYLPGPGRTNGIGDKGKSKLMYSQMEGGRNSSGPGLWEGRGLESTGCDFTHEMGTLLSLFQGERS